MVGGIVEETIDTGDRIWVNVRGQGNDKHRTLAIWIERTPESRSISEGDCVWWQGSHALWTPKGSPFLDKKLNRIGCSGIPRPELAST